jgi:uncharacterized membrane protein
MAVEQVFHEISSAVALTFEFVSVVLITFGGVGALIGVGRVVTGHRDQHSKRKVFLTLARWMVLGLEFTLAADVIRTAIAPSWKDIGQLAAIAAIRTFLNYFLERDLEHATVLQSSPAE